MAKFFLSNPGFELGDRDWAKDTDFSIINDAVNARSGSWVGRLIGNDLTRITIQSSFAVRSGATINSSSWYKDGTSGTAKARIRWLDKDGAVIDGVSGDIISAGGGYTQSSLSGVAPDRTKAVEIGLLFSVSGGFLQGTWYVDDAVASGDIIESIPTTAKIASHRIVPADTIGVFDPLIGTDKFTEFNAGMSDKWAGVYTFIPALGGDLGELVSFIRRLGRTERLFCFDPDRTVPLNGIVNDMTVDGPITNGTNKIPVKAGPVSSTALVAGDYMEVKDQYFQLQRDLEIGPEGTGEEIVWPAVRSTLADGEDVITNNPKMVARITSDLDWRRIEARPVEITIAWEEV